jgi:ribosomal protein L13E
VNSKTLKSIEEIATAVAIVHNLVRIGRGEVITNLTVPSGRDAHHRCFIGLFADLLRRTTSSGQKEKR